MTEGQRDRYIRKNGVTRHIIMIRHGQYDETHKVRNMRLSYMYAYLVQCLIANITDNVNNDNRKMKNVF
jgi:hypothetical protein